MSRPLRPAPGRARALRSTLPGPAASRPAARLGATVGAIATALALVAVGALAFPAVAGAQARHVVVVSDSIFLGAQSPFGARMQSAGWTVDFDGAVSRSTLAGADAVRSRRATITDSLVISLGANDSGNTSTFRSRVDAVMAAADGVPNVYWLTIREVRPYYAPANQVLRDAATRYPNLHVVDWNAASAGRDGLTSGDGLHLTPAGAGEIAALVGTAVTDGSVPVPAAAPPPPPPEPVAQSVPVDPPVVDPAIAAVGAPTAAGDVQASVPVEARGEVPAFDRSDLVRVSEPIAVGGPPARPATSGPGSGPAVVVVAVMALVASVVILLRRSPWMPFVLRAPSIAVRRSPVTRAELRAARIAGSMDRHPSVAAVPPVPDEAPADPGARIVSGSSSQS